MSFESRTNTITIKEDGDFLADSGSLLLKVLRDIGSGPDAPPALAADWATVAGWLDCEQRELSQEDYERFGVVFRSYLARGVAPSAALEEPFKKFALMAKTERWPMVPVPPDLIPVFRRMMATDRAIQEKRAKDATQFATALKSLSRASPRLAPRGGPMTGQPGAAVRLSWIPLVASIAILLMASADQWPYGFYQLLRLFVTGTAIYIVTQTVNRRPYWPWIMGGIALLFNPILPISFSREEWQPIDFGVAVVFLVVLVQTRRARF